MSTARELTDDAQAERDDFDASFRDGAGCTCFISPPYSWCTHPGNPHNQEDDDCYKPLEPAVDIIGVTRAIVGAV